MSSGRTLPVWLMGLTNLTLGIGGAIALLITPQLLSALHVPEPRIAGITGLALVPPFASVLAAPILDVWVSRKTYAIGFMGLAGLFNTLALLSIGNLDLLGWLLFCAMFSTSMAISACGGWLGSLVSKDRDADLGAWFTVANILGFGVTSIIGVALVRSLPPGLGAVLLGGLAAAPVLVCLAIPGTQPDGRLASESFGQFFRDLLALIRRPSVLLTILLFGVPAASFALTNTLGGLGRDYGASEQFVALAGGLGVTIAGLIGSLATPRLLRHLAPRPFYLVVGTLGALFTLCAILLPRTPGFFALTMIGENIAQAAALATANVVIFRTMGKDNPFAATEFALLIAAVSVPISYMQVLDGQAYGRGGLNGMYLTDAGLGLAACAALALILWLARGLMRPVA